MHDEAAERERLRRANRNSRTLIRAGQIAAALGWLWLAALALSILPFTPAAMVAALAAGVGGLVLAGSSQTTTLELEAALTALDPAPIATAGDDKVVSLFGPAARQRRARPRL